jgi:IMP cyclohydrolase
MDDLAREIASVVGFLVSSDVLPEEGELSKLRVKGQEWNRMTAEEKRKQTYRDVKDFVVEEAFNHGVAAAAQGKDTEDNPFPVGDYRRPTWEEGHRRSVEFAKA